jgi:hypothetical protein
MAMTRPSTLDRTAAQLDLFRRRTMLAKAALVLAAMLSAADYSRAENDHCSLLTMEEIASVIGGSPVYVWETASLREPTCVYGPGAGRAYLYLTWFSDDNARQVFLARKKSRDGLTEPVVGIGEDAYWLPSTLELHVLRRGAYLKIMFSPQAGLGAEHAKKLAKIALGKIE